MKKLICCILAALLAALPCCGVAEKSFYEANREEIEYYCSAISEYINVITKSTDFKMEQIDLFESDYQSAFYLTNNYTRVPVFFVGESGEQGIRHFGFYCDISDYLRLSEKYISVVLAITSLCFDILNVNYPDHTTEDDIKQGLMQIIEYCQKGDMNSYYDYYFDYEGHLVMLDISFMPSDGSTTDGTITIWLDV